jgi:hypothetical protein
VLAAGRVTAVALRRLAARRTLLVLLAALRLLRLLLARRAAIRLPRVDGTLAARMRAFLGGVGHDDDSSRRVDAKTVTGDAAPGSLQGRDTTPRIAHASAGGVAKKNANASST